MSGFFHGVTVTNVDTGARTIALPSSSIIGLVDTFTPAPALTAQPNDLMLITSEREAIAALRADGLVEARKNRGFFVRESGRAVDAADGDLEARARPDDLALESAAANWSTAHWFAA